MIKVNFIKPEPASQGGTAWQRKANPSRKNRKPKKLTRNPPGRKQQQNPSQQKRPRIGVMKNVFLCGHLKALV
jgi:hypothetical protein